MWRNVRPGQVVSRQWTCDDARTSMPRDHRHGMCSPAWLMRAVALWICLGCLTHSSACEVADADAGADTDGAGSSGPASTTGITTTGPATSAGYDPSVEPPPPGTSCEACLYGWCRDELQTCLDDTGCSCWLGCGDTGNESACQTLCGMPGPPVVELFGCFQRWCEDACADEDPSDTTGDTTSGGVSSVPSRYRRTSTSWSRPTSCSSARTRPS